jgi:transcription elongation factor GreA-like protein/transcription elongation GreA/GreB family factor
MSYLEDFKTQINNRDFAKIMTLWEEYCTSDSVETEEFVQLLQSLKNSDFAKMFGNYIEMALPLWKTFQDQGDAYLILKHLIDLETTNTPLLADITLEVLTKRYGNQPEFNERLRLVGLRSRDNFQGALSNYDLLSHMQQGKFVYHNGGWGTGEIMEVSPVREQMAIEFENVSGRKHITYSNAFKTLIPLRDEHFLARRFADPDKLEKEAKQDPVAVIKMLLKDLGPKSAAEIKDEMCELVIPEGEWTKWWQATRAKLKKDSMVQTPDNLKDPFILRKKEVSHEEWMDRAFHSKADNDEIILTSYNSIRDLPQALKKQETKDALQKKLLDLLKDPNLTKPQELQILILLEDYFSHPLPGKPLKEFVGNLKEIENTINSIDILAIKKKALTLVRENDKHWIQRFCTFMHSVQQGSLRDYLLKELNSDKEAKKALVKLLQELLDKPASDPELLLWYFQKIAVETDLDIPFSDKAGQCQSFEALLILLSIIESKPEYKELTKKIYVYLLAKRYAVVRNIIENTSLEFIKEFLLLASKCQTFNDHDQKILRSLAEVVHPSLAAGKPHKSAHHDSNIIWTTEAGYLKTQERAKTIGTVEIIENAREIEAARALGDLRENSEYKFACERRSRLQGELRALSDQLKHARLITPHDISPDKIGVGNIVKIADSNGKAVVYTILGPWEADPDSNILSFQSKLAQSMHGLKKGETFTFRDEEFKILDVKSYLNK